MSEGDSERWQVGDLTIDVGGQTVTRDGETIVLPQLSFRFLLALVRAAPNLLSVDDLMERVWPGIFVNSETVTQRAKLLRDALGDDPKSPRYFSVRRGVGYQLVPSPVRLDAREPEAAAYFSGRPRGWTMALAAVILAIVSLGGIAAITAWPTGSHSAQLEPVRVAVLPFDNLSSDPADAYIARSIPEIVLNRLSSVRGLTVISRDSALLGQAGATPEAVAERLQAAYVVKGSVQRTGKTLRVTSFVVDTSDGDRLWSERFDWPVDRLYALQDRIAERVASSLESKARGVGSLAPASVPTRNADAYLAYLKGMSLLGRYTVSETDAAAAQFARAVELDPQFADALVALFDAKMQGADLRKDDLGPFRAKYQPLLDRALRIEPASGPALFAKAMWSGNPSDSRAKLFRRAAELDPSNSRGLTAYAQFLDMRANSDTGSLGADSGPGSLEAQRLLDRVLAVDPLSPRARAWAIQRRFTRSTPEQMEREQARELALDPQNYLIAHRYAFRRWYIKGETAEAIELMERVIASDPEQPTGVNYALAIYLDAGDVEAARVLAATTPATRQSSRILLSQYVGDWRGAGTAALGRGGYLFNVYQSWNWAQAVRDMVLKTRGYERGAQAIAARFGFDLDDPRVVNVAQLHGATALAHILLAQGEQRKANRLLASTVQWIDAHPNFGLAIHMRIRATAMMLLGERDEALSNLRASVVGGHDIHHWWYVVDRDPVWAPVRSDPRFKQVAAMYRQAARAQREKLDALRRAGKVPVRPALASTKTNAT